MDEVFLRSSAEDPSADEVLDAGDGRQFPRWVWPLTVLLVAAGVMTAALVHSHHATPRAAPTPVGPTASAGIGLSSDFVDALIAIPDYGEFVTLSGGVVTVLDAAGRPLAASLLADGTPADGSQVRLVYDGAGSVIWVVPVANNAPGRLNGYDASDLHRVAHLSLPDVVDDVAVLDGRLYLLTGGRLLRVSNDRSLLEPATTINAAAGSLVADPTRHRLLYLEYTEPVQVRSWSPGGGLGRSSRLPIAKGDLAVVDGTIWVGGFPTVGGAQLARLDPATLRPGRNVAAHRLFGPGAVLDDTGDESLYVRNGSTGELWCLDGRNGAVRQHLGNLDGTIASTRQHAFVVAGPLAEIDLGTCAG